MSIKEEIERLDKKMEDCIKDPKVLEYQKKYGTIPEENLTKRFTI